METSRRQQKIRQRQQKEAAERKRKPETYTNHTPFRHVERNFKSRVPPPDFSEVIHLRPCDALHPVSLSLDHPFFAGKQTTAYVVKSVPGLIVIPNPFTPAAEREVVRACLSEYSKAPNMSNLDTHYAMPDEGLWRLHQRQSQECVPRKSKAQDTASQQSQEQQRRVKACDDAFRPDLNGPKPDPLPAETVPLLTPTELLYKLRWVTLGYQYHWPTKTYHFDRRFPVPRLVHSLSHATVRAVEDIGYADWKNTYKADDYVPEAGVINFYQYKDTLMGHVDRSELNMEAPLVSMSFGNACIYVIGGPTQDIKPAALQLNSGDIVVMTGPCRRSFHGVPRIIENSLPGYLQPTADDGDWAPYGSFMQTTRINLNIRQVFPKSSMP
ncbi:hypothetical protein BCR43DRAFT_435054 [Syncephalastrum racemosum]|uniref:Fe2OG dioxygenase domain-containing protein n=1 Tax=Syncephalastrum racemosum TaxID=13706 RepID=A0A1X2HMY1_SYNRA|nr:hypothetical protein BCR43DRAFT_435054 [Syncephalastrum racemosum]